MTQRGELVRAAYFKAEERLAGMTPEEIAQSDEERTALAAWLAKQQKH